MRILVVCDFLFKVYGIAASAIPVRAGHEVAILSRSHALEFGGSTVERNRGAGNPAGGEDIKFCFVVPGLDPVGLCGAGHDSSCGESFTDGDRRSFTSMRTMTLRLLALHERVSNGVHGP